MKPRMGILPVGLVLALTLAGCSKEAAPPPQRVTTPVLAEPPPATPSSPGETTPAPTPVRAASLPSHQVLYDAIQKYMFEHQGRAAKDVHELVAKGYLPSLPPPPPGKKYDLNQRSAVLQVVDK